MSIHINGSTRDSLTHVQDAEQNFGAYRMAANKTMYEPQRSTDFRFVVVGLEEMENNFGGAEYSDIQSVLSYSVISCNVPHFQIEPLTMRMGNSVMKFAGTPSFSEGTIVVRDFIGVNTPSMLMAWQHQAYDVNTDKVGTLDAYNKNCYLIEYSPDHQVVRRWHLWNCWVSNITEDPFNRENNASVRNLTATIQYDRATFEDGDGFSEV